VLSCCISRADAKGENLRAHFFQRRDAKVTNDSRSLIGPQIPLPLTEKMALIFGSASVSIIIN
jgi:hypothetical protein